MESAVVEWEDVSIIRIPMSKTAFLNWNPDDGSLYEYDNGFAEQVSGMKKTERYIISNIQDKFLKTQAFHEQAKLFEESDVWVTEEQKRILDMAFLLAKRYLIQPIAATQFQPL